MSRFPALTLLAGAVLSLAACSSTAPLSRVSPAPADAVVAPANAPNDNLNAVLWVQRSQEYRASALQTWKLAGAQLDAALADGSWTALLPEEGGKHQSAKLKPAVVVDVDETVLDNSPYQARLVAQDAQYDEASWDAWVREQKARPVPGVVEFAKAAQARGEQVGLVLYPGALHDFDHPRLEVKERDNIAYSASGTGKVTVGTNMAAREDALKRVKAFLIAP